MFCLQLVQAVRVVGSDSVNRRPVPLLVEFDTTSILCDVICDVALDTGHIVLSSEATQRLRELRSIDCSDPRNPRNPLTEFNPRCKPKTWRQTRNWLDVEHRRVVARQQNSRQTARGNWNRGKQKEALTDWECGWRRNGRDGKGRK